MATEANKFKVGVFLIGGFLLFNAALVWIGASSLIETTKPCVTYFAESVQGLDVGSAVKFRGVPLGRVTDIRVAPDGALVEVRMEIKPEFTIAPGMRAMLTSSGITGLAFVELGLSPEGAALPAPRLSFAPRGTYIPSQRSFLTNLMSTLTEVATQLRGLDLPGLVADYRGLAQSFNRTLAGPEVGGALQHVSQAAAALEGLTRKAAATLEEAQLAQTAQRVNAVVEDLGGGVRSAKTLLADPRLGETLADVRAAAGGLRSFAEQMGAEAAAVHAGERLDAVEQNVKGTLGGVDAATAAAVQAAARWERTAGGVEHSLQDAVTRIGRAAGRLENLARALEASPSRILLEKPAAEDIP
jgi:ABC-type transporter Mla subunit MlaD